MTSNLRSVQKYILKLQCEWKKTLEYFTRSLPHVVKNIILLPNENCCNYLSFHLWFLLFLSPHLLFLICFFSFTHGHHKYLLYSMIYLYNLSIFFIIQLSPRPTASTLSILNYNEERRSNCKTPYQC